CIKANLDWLICRYILAFNLLIKSINMKNFLVILTFYSFLSFSAKSQESNFKPFKVDVSLGYAIPGGKGAKGGVLFAVEPKYAIISNLSVGLRMEAAIVARFSGYDENGDPM